VLLLEGMSTTSRYSSEPSAVVPFKMSCGLQAGCWAARAVGADAAGWFAAAAQLVGVLPSLPVDMRMGRCQLSPGIAAAPASLSKP
jgi:hypothetical protein